MLGYRKPMSPISHFLIFFFFFFFLFFLSVPVAFGDNDDTQQLESVKLDLLHRHHPKVAEQLHGDMKSAVQGINDRLKDIHDHDNKRHRSISASLNRKEIEEKTAAEKEVEEKEKEAEAAARKEMEDSGYPFPPTSPTPIGMKMISGADFGSSEYFVQLKVGTPPQTFMLIADTGSDLTWIKCRYRRCVGNCSTNAIHRNRNRRKIGFKRAFLANRSTSFKTVDCNSDECKRQFSDLFSTSTCESANSPCRYDYSYSGGASAKGIFARETITVCLTNGKEKQLTDSIIGCTESALGKIFGGADGVIGLGSSPYSFPFKAAENANGGGFAYCLVDHLSDQTATSYFILGGANAQSSSATSSVTPSGNMSYTRLFIGEAFSSFYGVVLNGISADGVMLNIPPRVWDINAGGGTIIDSGTSLTMLAAPAFEMVLEAVIPKLKNFERILMEPFEYCFNSSQYTDDMAPRLRFHFFDGAVFEPPTKSYIISVGDNLNCVGFVSMAFPATSIIGNILQQNHLWQYDFNVQKIGFAPSQCV